MTDLKEEYETCQKEDETITTSQKICEVKSVPSCKSEVVKKVIRSTWESCHKLIQNAIYGLDIDTYFCNRIDWYWYRISEGFRDKHIWYFKIGFGAFVAIILRMVYSFCSDSNLIRYGKNSLWKILVLGSKFWHWLGLLVKSLDVTSKITYFWLNGYNEFHKIGVRVQKPPAGLILSLDLLIFP